MPPELWFPPFFLCLWLAIFAFAARIGGWHALAQRFRAEAEPAGERFRWQSVGMGQANYGGSTTMVVSPSGLYLRVIPPFRFFHPPLLIPWSEMRVVQVREGWLTRDALVEVGQPVLVRFRMPLRIVEAASEYLLANNQ